MPRVPRRKESTEERVVPANVLVPTGGEPMTHESPRGKGGERRDMTPEITQRRTNNCFSFLH